MWKAGTYTPVSPSPRPVLWLLCDNLCTLSLSLSRLLSLSIVSLKPAHPSSAMWGQEAAPISHPFPIPFFWHFLDLNILCGTCIILLYLCRGITLSMHWIIYGNDKSTCLRRTIVSSSSFCISLGQIIRFPWNSYGKYSKAEQLGATLKTLQKYTKPFGKQDFSSCRRSLHPTM